MRYYTKDDLQDALFEALDNNKNEAEFVKKFVTNAARILKRKPQNYRYYGVYWWPLKKLMLEHKAAGIDDFIDHNTLEKADLNDNALNCVAAWAFQESRLNAMELPSNSVLMEDNAGNMEEIYVIDEAMEEKVKFS